MPPSFIPGVVCWLHEINPNDKAFAAFLLHVVFSSADPMCDLSPLCAGGCETRIRWCTHICQSAIDRNYAQDQLLDLPIFTVCLQAPSYGITLHHNIYIELVPSGSEVALGKAGSTPRLRHRRRQFPCKHDTEGNQLLPLTYEPSVIELKLCMPHLPILSVSSLLGRVVECTSLMSWVERVVDWDDVCCHGFLSNTSISKNSF